jgi:CheY-like chemotaxis protein
MMETGNKRPIHIWLIEDDTFQAHALRDALHAHFESLHIHLFHEGSAASEAIESPLSPMPDVIITDLLLPWSTPTRDRMTPLGDWDSGLRLIQEIRKNPRLQNVPIILWSVTEQKHFVEELPTQSVIVVNKARGDNETMIRAIRSALILQGTEPHMKDTTWRNVADSAELKPGVFGFRVDLKKLSKVFKRRKRSQRGSAD